MLLNITYILQLHIVSKTYAIVKSFIEKPLFHLKIKFHIRLLWCFLCYFWEKSPPCNIYVTKLKRLRNRFYTNWTLLTCCFWQNITYLLIVLWWSIKIFLVFCKEKALFLKGTGDRKSFILFAEADGPNFGSQNEDGQDHCYFPKSGRCFLKTVLPKADFG